MSKRTRAGFTLLEMLVVLAITAVLLGIIIVPVIQSFNFTRAAESFAEQQQRGRILVDQIARDIASGVAVADNEGTNGESIIQLSYNGTYIEEPLYYSRLDVYKPALGGALVNGGFVDKSGHVDPTLNGPAGQVTIPAAQGATIVRYFLCLQSPLEPNPNASPTTPTYIPGVYNNPYEGVLGPLAAQYSNLGENLYVLRRIEFQPYLSTGYNSTLFKQMPDPNNPGQFLNQPYLNDPYWCCLSPNDPNIHTVADQNAQAARVQAILQQSTIVTEETRFDMIEPLYDYSTRKPLLDQNNNPRVLSLIQFRPSPVSQESAVGPNPVTLGNETQVPSGGPNNFPNLGIAPNVLRTSLADWSGAVIQVTPYNGSSMFTSNTYQNDFEQLNTSSDAQVLPGSTSTPAQTEQNLLMLVPFLNTSLPPNLVLFDLNKYAASVTDTNTSAATGAANPLPYPFSQGVYQAEQDDINAGIPDWLTLTQTMSYTPTTTESFRDEFIPFEYDPHQGQINSAFGNWEVGNPNTTTPNADNVPQISTAETTMSPPSGALTPSEDTSSMGTGVNFYSPMWNSIDEFYNVVYNQYPNLASANNVQRFVDLRMVPQLDGWASPMDPEPSAASPLAYNLNGTGTLSASKTPWVSGWTGWDNISIVPGSDEVIAPDQNPGPNYGNPVRYMRVPSNPGPDQYSINYVNQAEPPDYQVIDPSMTVGPANQTWDPLLQQWELDGNALATTDPVTMILQPRYKAGYVQFDSDPNTVMPAGPGGASSGGFVKISYRFQFNRPADAISVSYDSRQLINVLLSIRAYAQTTNMPNAQTVTLQASAPVKNFIR